MTSDGGGGGEAAAHQQCRVNLDAVAFGHHGGPVVGSIDQGTSSTRYIVFNSKGEIVASAQMEHRQIYPEGEDKVGWHEHDAMEIWTNTKHCVNAVHDALSRAAAAASSSDPRGSGGGQDDEEDPSNNLAPSAATSSSSLASMGADADDGRGGIRLRAVGITNQRETLVAWNASTGLPYHNAIVWDDLRTTQIANDIANDRPETLPWGIQPIDRLRSKTGLPIASYFSGTKLRWLVRNVPNLRRDLSPKHPQRPNVMFGTIDSWIVYNLTGSTLQRHHIANIGGRHITDVTNASRWLLMDLETLEWDEDLVRDVVCGTDDDDLDFPMSSLPEIRSSSEIYGTCNKGCGIDALENVPVASILGDQQAALFGQAGFGVGDAKCTYGTGLFLMMNTGYGSPVPSKHGLLSTVAFRIGQGNVAYALEGSVSHSGSVIQWLRDQLQIIGSAPESEALARTTSSNDGLYFVPAFAGLFAPYWRSDARGCIVGMTATHTKAHVCRAALEAAAYQARELFDAMYYDSNVQLNVLKVDGGATANRMLMQFQADMINVPVVAPQVTETTAIGAAFAAGLAVGIWDSLEQIQALWAVDKTYTPSMNAVDRSRYWSGWKKAVTKSFGWIDDGSRPGLNDKAAASGGMLSTSVRRLSSILEAASVGTSGGQDKGRYLVATLAALAVGFVVGARCSRK